MGGFHSHGGTPKNGFFFLVGKSHLEMDDDYRGTPILGNPPYLFSAWSPRKKVSGCFRFEDVHFSEKELNQPQDTEIY